MPPVAPAVEAVPARATLVTASLAATVAVVALMQTISVPLLPELPGIFDTDLAAASWVATATLVVGAVVNPIVGRMGDLYGRRSLMVGCLVASVVGSVAGALADSLAELVVARGLQGVGSGAIPLAYGVIRDELPPGALRRGVALVTAAGTAVGAGLGPVAMGGVLAAHGWRSLFWISAATCGLTLVLVVVSTRPATRRRAARFDLVGALLIAAALVLVLLGITGASRSGWSSPLVLSSVSCGVAVAIAWGRWELRRPDPLVDLATSGRGPVLVSHIGGFMVGFGIFTQFIVVFTIVGVPQASGFGMGGDAALAGLVQVPGALALGAAIVTGERLIARIGAHGLMELSAAALTLGFGAMALWHATVLELVLGVVVVSVGLGAGFCAAPILIVDHVRADQMAEVNAVNALARVVGSVLASALVASLLASDVVRRSGSSWPAEHTFARACGMAAVVAVVAGVFARRARPLSNIHHEVRML